MYVLNLASLYHASRPSGIMDAVCWWEANSRGDRFATDHHRYNTKINLIVDIFLWKCVAKALTISLVVSWGEAVSKIGVAAAA